MLNKFHNIKLDKILILIQNLTIKFSQIPQMILHTSCTNSMAI